MILGIDDHGRSWQKIQQYYKQYPSFMSFGLKTNGLKIKGFTSAEALKSKTYLCQTICHKVFSYLHMLHLQFFNLHYYRVRCSLPAE